MSDTRTSPSADAAVAPHAAQHRRAMLAVLLAAALATLDTAIANTALPSIALDLHATPAASVWIINAYQLVMIATLLPLAALSDVIGHRRIYLVGLAVFTVASLACALADTLATLTAARVLQGLGAAAIMSVQGALIRFLNPPDRLGRAIGLNALVVGVSFAVGPTIASIVLSMGPWPWLFGINVPLGLVAFLFALPALPRTTRSSHGFDPLAAGLNMIAFAAMIFALGEAAQRAPAAPTLIAAALACAFFVLLLRRERGHPAPMLPVDLFRRPVFLLSVLTAIGSFAAQGLAFVSLPFYFEDLLGRSQVETGFLMTPWSAVVALAAPIAGRLSDRYPPGALGAVGLGIMAAGMASLALMPAHPSVLNIVVRMAICGMGFGFFQSPNMRALLSSAPPERSGSASGMVSTARLVGQTIGSALVALCFGIAQRHGPTLALAMGAAFSLAAAVASGLRLVAPAPAPKRV